MKRFTSKDIDIMQQDVESEFQLTAFIESTKAMFEAQGRDFYGEFIEWSKANGHMAPYKELHL